MTNHIIESQDEVFAFLGDPSTHHAPVKRIDTHAASVFLAGAQAFKVKRAVRFPFLDFSTLARRKAACDAELTVNHAFASDIYRGVVPITREADGGLAINGAGEAIEWAVVMRRFNEEQTFDKLAECGEISLELADALGRVVASAHAAAPLADAPAWITAVASYLDQNTTEFRESPELFSGADVDSLDTTSRAVLARISALLFERGRLGFVRRGHGDLHLGNIALLDGKPVPFDAIEFDPLIATGDVLYDLAFLLMDLAERGLMPQANVVLNRYLTETRRTEDLDGLAALPFFLSLRAAIRAKVTAAKREHTASELRAEIGTSAVTYFRLAGELLSPSPPRLIAIGGLSGTGKSALARELAPDVVPVPGAVVLRSDVERKVLFGRTETDRLPPEAYTADVTRQVYDTLMDKALRVLKAGHSAIVDAVFAREDERAAMDRLHTQTKVPFLGLFLDATLTTRVARVGTRVADASDADAHVAQAQEGYDLGSVSWTHVNANGTPAETLALARRALANVT